MSPEKEADRDESSQHIIDPTLLLKEAVRQGIQPLTFRQIRLQLKHDDLLSALLFDTPPFNSYNGNHWRVSETNSKLGLITIHACNNNGTNDLELPPFTVSQDEILFTGVNVIHYIYNGHPIPLSAAITIMKDPTAVPHGLKMDYQVIYWADARGTLVPKDDHPLFTKR